MGTSVVRRASSIILPILLLSGCVTGSSKTPNQIETAGATPVSVGFVYKENIHAVGASFSLEKAYWRRVFPAAATAFENARRYSSVNEALSSGSDLVVIAKNTVHGGKKRFKFSLLVTVRDSKERLIMETAFKEKLATNKTLERAFTTVGQQLKDQLNAKIRVRKKTE